ncbi:MAG: hypothetical protein OHK0056_10410 [Bacteriovoracaceae bacterium]
MGITNKFAKILVLGTALFLAGCGYFTDEPVEDTDTFRNERLQLACQLDAARFGKILEEDVTDQINCLEDSLNNFTKYVRRNDKESISEKELRAFVERFFPKDAAKIKDSLSLLFDINSILLNDDKTSISNRNIARLSKLLKVLNIEAVAIFKQFELLKEKKVDFWIARAQVNQSFSKIEETLLGMIESDVSINRLPPTLDLEKFVRKLRDLVPNSSVSDLTLDLILNAKRLLVGGNKEILNYGEVKSFSLKIQRVLTLAFDIFFVKEDYFNSRAKLYEFYGQKLNELESFFYQHPIEEKIFTQDSVIATIKHHLRDSENLELYIKLANETKRLMIDGGESTDFYTFGQIKLVTTLLHLGIDGLIFYEQASPILKIAQDLPPNEKKELRLQYLKYAQELKERIDLVTRDRSIFPGRMEILAYGKFLNRELDVLELDETFLETVFNVKKLFAGGQKEFMTWPEFQRLVERTGKIAEFYFDFISYNKEKYTKPESYRLYLDSVVSVIESLYTGELYRPILTMDDLFVVAKHLLKKDDLEAFAPTLALIKEKWIGGYGKVFTMWDVQSLLKQAQILFEEIYFNYLSYSLYEKELSNTNVIRELEYRHHPEYGRFSAERIKELRANFMELVTRFRFFRDDNKMILYSDKVVRNVDGLVEVGLFRWAFKVIASVFGHQVPEKPNIFELNIDEVDTTLNAFKPVLEYFGLWSTSISTFGRNTLLLSDLFQSMSDGNMNIGIDEFSEYAGLVLVAIKIGDEMLRSYDKYCENIGTEEAPQYGVLCYREHFFKLMLDDFGYNKYFPKLDAYIKKASKDEWYTFLSSVEGFARDVDDPMTPMDKRNLLLVIGAMMNIESTFIRYDANKSNLLDNSELVESFKTYEKAIRLVAELQPEQFKFTKSIYFYMIKEMKIPSKLQLASFHYRPWNGMDKITAKRLNIGAILYYLVNNAAKEKE